MNSPPVMICLKSRMMVVISKARPRREVRQFERIRVFIGVCVLGLDMGHGMLRLYLSRH